VQDAPDVDQFVGLDVEDGVVESGDREGAQTGDVEVVAVAKTADPWSG